MKGIPESLPALPFVTQHLRQPLGDRGTAGPWQGQGPSLRELGDSCAGSSGSGCFMTMASQSPRGRREKLTSLENSLISRTAKWAANLHPGPTSEGEGLW